MTFAAEKGTLARWGTNPFFSPRDMTAVPSHRVGGACKAFRLKTQRTCPDADAARFYLWNHAVGEIRAKANPFAPLPEEYAEVIRTYAEWVADEAAPRMFYYLLMICAHEAAYGKILSASVGKNLGPKAREAWDRLKTGSPHDEVERGIEELSIGGYVDLLVWVFENAKFDPQYGGPKWAAIAITLRRFIDGTTTAEVLLDTAYTLAHNTGPIFNKGVLFTKQSYRLVEILDVQRAGMIPQYFAEGRIVSEDFAGLARILGWDVDSMYVDWFAVEALGAVNKYPAYKEAQVAKHGPSKHGPKPAGPGYMVSAHPEVVVPIIKRSEVVV